MTRDERFCVYHQLDIVYERNSNEQERRPEEYSSRSY